MAYDSRTLNTASTYQSFLHHAVLQHQQHPPNTDIKPHPLPQTYHNWSHFLEDRHAAQHTDYGVTGSTSAIQQYSRPEEALYFGNQSSTWNYGVSSSQPVSSGGGISTDVRCIQPDTIWPPVNSVSYPNTSFPVEAERSVL